MPPLAGRGKLTNNNINTRVAMLSFKDDISMSDSGQRQNLSYHFKQAMFHIEETRRSLFEADRSLFQVLIQLTELKEIIDETK